MVKYLREEIFDAARPVYTPAPSPFCGSLIRGMGFREEGRPGKMMTLAHGGHMIGFH